MSNKKDKNNINAPTPSLETVESFQPVNDADNTLKEESLKLEDEVVSHQDIAIDI
jgi:hypothetical protein